MDSNKDGKPWCSFLSEAAVAIGDGAADRREIITALIFETTADAKFPILVFTADCVQSARVLTFTFVVLRYGTLSAVSTFRFQKPATAVCDMGIIRVMQHDAFPALRFDFFQEGLDVGAIMGENLAYNGNGGFRVGFRPALQYGKALVKITCDFGHVRSMEFGTAPVASIRTDGGRNLLEVTTRSTKFAVYRVG